MKLRTPWQQLIPWTRPRSTALAATQSALAALAVQAAWVALCALPTPAVADADMPVTDMPVADVPVPGPATGGKLLLTGGVSQVEGSAGGGLVPWAVIGGYGTGDQLGGNAHYTYLKTQDFSLSTYGVAMGIANRVELSVARQTFDTRNVGPQLGLPAGFKFNQDIFGVKVRVIGDTVLDQDSWLPQIAAGIQFKHNDQGDVVKAVGAASNSGTDFYVSGTKLLLAQSLLLNATLRMTKANQFGLLGFGGDRSNAYHPEFEGSAAYLLSKSLTVGAEYRTKPNNLGFAREQNAYDAFVAWAPTKHISLTAAYVELGDVATIRNQHGAYLSAQVGF